jgi:hypothetical protein
MKRIKKFIWFLWIWKRYMTWYQENYCGLRSEERDENSEEQVKVGNGI